MIIDADIQLVLDIARQEDAQISPGSELSDIVSVIGSDMASLQPSPPPMHDEHFEEQEDHVMAEETLKFSSPCGQTISAPSSSCEVALLERQDPADCRLFTDHHEGGTARREYPEDLPEDIQAVKAAFDTGMPVALIASTDWRLFPFTVRPDCKFAVLGFFHVISFAVRFSGNSDIWIPHAIADAPCRLRASRKQSL